MPATSLRSRLAKNLSPLKTRTYSGKGDLTIGSQTSGDTLFDPLSPSTTHCVRDGATRIRSAITPDWLPILLEQAMPEKYGRIHELPLIGSQPIDLSSVLISDVYHEEINLLGWLRELPQLLVDLIDHLFEPLGWTDVDGRHYGTYQTQAEKESSEQSRGHPRSRSQPRKSYELTECTSDVDNEQVKFKSRLTFWDIIWPILQPPLDLGMTEPVFLPYPLYPFQQPGVEFLVEHPSALLGDEMGTGKTVMTSVAMRLLFRRAQVQSALVVCPVSVLRVWDEHLIDWAPDLSVTVVHGQRDARHIDWAAPAHIYLTTYDTLRSDMQNGNLPQTMWEKFDLTVADEIQYIKNPNSKRSQALRRLRPAWRWGLSGTPMENKPDDVISIFRFLKPGLIGDNDLPHVISSKMAPYFLRRRKKDVLPDLPPKERQPLWLDLDPDQRRAYREFESQIQSHFIGWHERGENISRVHIFAAIQKLKQICNFAPGKTWSPKVQALRDIVEEVAESDCKVIVFSQYVEEGVSKLADRLKSYGVARVVGGQSRATRDTEIDRFKTDSDVHVMLATIKSGGVGLTLTEASYVVHFDHWWNPALKWQAEDRVHRSGQEASKINIYEFWMNDTIDQRIWDILEQKRVLFEEIVDSLSAETIDRSISDEEWLSVLGVDVEGAHRETPEQAREPVQRLDTAEILRKLQEMDPFEFEGLVGELFKYLGFPYTKVTGRSRDGGIDVIASRNTSDGPERVAVQCKRYRNDVGVEIARELAGVVSSDPAFSRGILVTTGRLTRACRRFLGRVPELETIAGLQLAKCVRDFGIF
jgi:superfamily II DNA or RNA helicase/HJR/Mrr/RecB family endonuclease